MSTVDLGELSAIRLAELAAMTDQKLLFKAADIIGSEPIVAHGAFRSQVREARAPHRTDIGKPCHCLMGAVREAAGIYCPQITPLTSYRTLPKVDYQFGEIRKNPIALRIISVLDLSSLDQVLIGKCAIQRAWADIVHVYSDIELAPLGAAGPAKAAEILRAAAQTDLDLATTKET